MKKLFQLLTICCICTHAFAQQNKSPVPAMPDVNKLVKMNPAELEAYKKQMIKQTSQQAADFADANNFNINKAAIPGLELKPPVKDIKRLSLIPSRPPTRLEITNSLQQSIQQISKGIPAPNVEEITKITNTIPVDEINDKAIAEFYHDNPKEGMLMLMQTAVRDVDELNLVNNLAAMMNMCGVEQKAVPLLMYAAEQVPNSSTILNNMGQAFLGLGDMQRAADFFRQCLAIDEMNPEANHSMGMMKYHVKDYDAAKSYFEKELSMCIRRSTLAMAYRMGRTFNLRAIARQRNKHKGAAQKDFLEEITVGRFELPEFPQSSKDAADRSDEFAAFSASVQEEMLFWKQNSLKTTMSVNNNSNDYPGLYHDLVEAMLEELNKEFTPEYLSPYGSEEAAVAADMMSRNSNAINQVKCPEAPPGSSVSLQHEFEVACCEKNKRPLADKLLSDIGSYTQPLFRTGILRWKAYINQLVEIVQIDPTPANTAMVCNAVSSYFAYLNTAMIFYSGAEINSLLPNCNPDFKERKLDSLIQSERNWRMDCPSWLNLEVDLGGVTAKADCNKYTLEGGSGVMAGYEYQFKSGKSTLLLGVGAKGKIGKILKVEAKSQFYLTFDNNKEFADFGVRDTYKLGLNVNPLPVGGVKVGANYAGVEATSTKSLLSGMSENKITSKGALAPLFE
jgi:tetratricopeptide (TPR) repeat protein